MSETHNRTVEWKKLDIVNIYTNGFLYINFKKAKLCYK